MRTASSHEGYRLTFFTVLVACPTNLAIP